MLICILHVFLLVAINHKGEVNEGIAYLAGAFDAEQPGVLRHGDKEAAMAAVIGSKNKKAKSANMCRRKAARQTLSYTPTAAAPGTAWGWASFTTRIRTSKQTM